MSIHLRVLKNRLRRFAQRLRSASSALSPPERNQQVRFDVRSRVNDRWDNDDRGYTITAKRNQLIQGDQPVFTMGSCFAREINGALHRYGQPVLPNWSQLEYDSAQIFIGETPHSRSLIYYDTFTMLQEFELATGNREVPEDDLYESWSQSFNPFGGKSFHFDPHRKNVCGATLESAIEARNKADQCIREGIQNAQVFILTLGLIECWRNQRTGSFVWGSSMRRTNSTLGTHVEFHLSSFEENYRNLSRIVELIRSLGPQKQVVVIVSPVSLARTFTDQDIVVANTESKSLLRAVAGQVARENDHVHYWPSYEIATKQDNFAADGRHVTREGVEFIVENFFRVHAQSPEQITFKRAA